MHKFHSNPLLIIIVFLDMYAAPLLCGTDYTTSESYEYRRQWLEDKLLERGNIFALDICAYAITLEYGD